MKSHWRKPKVKFVWRDCWIGVYSDSVWSVLNYTHETSYYTKIKNNWGRDSLKIYICLIPCFPIILEKS